MCSRGKWRDAASLIMLAKNQKLQNQTKNTFDYKTLLFQRHEKASFMPNSFVFPGGVSESADASAQWLKYFYEFGVREENLKLLTPSTKSAVVDTSESHRLEKAISLRITALRETFEEVGVLLCRDRKSLNDSYGYSNAFESFDRGHWQKKVHNDPTKFLKLCQELNVVPDIWNLYEWSAWLTPATYKKRFNTTFYIIALQETPNLIIERNEVMNYLWQTPAAFLHSFMSKSLLLPSPQYYELSRLLNCTNLEELQKFAQIRAANNLTTLLRAAFIKCSNGIVNVLNGDDAFPEDPEKATKFIKVEMTMNDTQIGVKRLHRVNISEEVEKRIYLNFDLPDGQLKPINIQDLPQSKL